MKFFKIAVGIVVLASPSAVWAQDVSVSAAMVSANHRLLYEPLYGGAIAVSFPRTSKTVAWGFAVERVRGEGRRTGSACGGFISPGTCLPEALEEKQQLTSVHGTMALQVVKHRHARFAVTGGVVLASVTTETRGRTSGNTLSASKKMWGGDVGVLAAWVPVLRVPVAVEVAGEIGGLRPIREGTELDGYMPFEDAFRVNRIRLGISWRF